MGLKSFVIIWLGITAAVANAADCTFQSELQKLMGMAPEPIPRSPLAIAREGEKTAFAWILQGEQKFQSLKRGEYVYLIDRKGRLIWGPRVPDLTADQLLVTHRSLEEAFRRILKEDPEIVAAGEFFLENNHVVYKINNKASTFRGAGAHLDFAEKRLKLAGLDFRSNTFRNDWSLGLKFRDHHEPELKATFTQSPARRITYSWSSRISSKRTIPSITT